MSQRPSWDQYFMTITRQVAERTLAALDPYFLQIRLERRGSHA